MNIGIYWSAVVAFTLIGFSSPVLAKPANLREADKLSKFSASLKELELRDSRHAATEEIGLASSWINRANSQLGKRNKRESLKRLVVQVETMNQLINVLIVQAELNEQSDAAIKRADQVEEELRDTSAKLKEITEKQRQFEKEIGQ